MFDSALLVFTDSTGIARVEAETFDIPSIALRPDQVQANQILFLNIETNTVEHVALLNEEQPFVAMSSGAYAPHIVEYMPLMEPIRVDPINIRHAFTVGCIPALNVEAITVDVDELEIDDNYLGSQIVDEMIINRRSPNQEMAKRTLQSNDIKVFNDTRAQLEALLHGS